MRKFYSFLLPALLLVAIVSCNKSKDPAGEEPPAPAETEPPVLVPITMAIHEKIGGFYLAHPARYNESTTRYPLIVFIHGGGQYGSGSGDLPRMLTEGIPKLLKEKKFPPAFDYGGRQYSFIVVAPQFKNFPDNDAVNAMINHAKNTYRIDTNRIYMVGFSLGGRVVCDYAAENAGKLAAIVPISGVSSYELLDKAKTIAQAGVAGWGFHNKPDQVFNWQDTQDFITQMKIYDPGKASQITIFSDSAGVQYHDAWTKATDPAYKERGKNIYEWMLEFRR